MKKILNWKFHIPLDKFIEWYMKLPVKVLVLGGAMQVLISVSILVVNK